MEIVHDARDTIAERGVEQVMQLGHQLTLASEGGLGAHRPGLDERLRGDVGLLAEPGGHARERVADLGPDRTFLGRAPANIARFGRPEAGRPAAVTIASGSTPLPRSSSIGTSRATAIRRKVPARGNSVLPLSIWYRAVREISARLASSSGPQPFE